MLVSLSGSDSRTSPPMTTRFGGGEGLAGDARFGLCREEGVEHGVRDPVAHLVGMPLRDGFGGEDEVLAGHVRYRSIEYLPPRQEAVVTG